MLHKEMDFLEKLSIRAAGGSKSEHIKPCQHSEQISYLIIEKEYFFFNSSIANDERNKRMQEIDEIIQKIGTECHCKV